MRLSVQFVTVEQFGSYVDNIWTGLWVTRPSTSGFPTFKLQTVYFSPIVNNTPHHKHPRSIPPPLYPFHPMNSVSCTCYYQEGEKLLACFRYISSQLSYDNLGCHTALCHRTECYFWCDIAANLICQPALWPFQQERRPLKVSFCFVCSQRLL